MVAFEAGEGEFKKCKNNKSDHQKLLEKLVAPIVENIRDVFAVDNWT